MIVMLVAITVLLSLPIRKLRAKKLFWKICAKNVSGTIFKRLSQPNGGTTLNVCTPPATLQSMKIVRGALIHISNLIGKKLKNVSKIVSLALMTGTTKQPEIP